MKLLLLLALVGAASALKCYSASARSTPCGLTTGCDTCEGNYCSKTGAKVGDVTGFAYGCSAIGTNSCGEVGGFAACTCNDKALCNAAGGLGARIGLTAAAIAAALIAARLL